MLRFLIGVTIAAAVPFVIQASGADASSSMRRAADPSVQLAGLVASDKAFAAAARDRILPDAIGAMLAVDAIMPARGGEPFLRSRDRIIAYLKASPASATARASWYPVRGGISADGRHGFTAGYITVTQADAKEQPGKYIAYWAHGADGWRVLAYKRAPRPEGAVEHDFRALAMPDPAAWRGAPIAGALDVMLAAERAFAAKAQIVGVGPAFAEYGRADAINMGAGVAFTEGADAIAAGFDPEAEPGQSIEWGPDFGLIAPSGDLGVSFGRIRPKKPPPGLAPGASPLGTPFFTIWRRDTPGSPWRYIAE